MYFNQKSNFKLLFSNPVRMHKCQVCFTLMSLIIKQQDLLMCLLASEAAVAPWLDQDTSIAAGVSLSTLQGAISSKNGVGKEGTEEVVMRPWAPRLNDAHRAARAQQMSMEIWMLHFIAYYVIKRTICNGALNKYFSVTMDYDHSCNCVYNITHTVT